MKCKLSGKVMNDQDPPMWIPLKQKELTEKQKEEAKKGSAAAAELKMQKGYLVCKSVFDALEENNIDPKSLEKEQKTIDLAQIDESGLKLVRCPLTGNLFKKS